MNTFPLSFAQERLWMLDRILPMPCAYNVARGIELRGPLNESALTKALDDLIQRHETLRTRIDAPDAAPVQRILPDGQVVLRIDDVQTRAEATRRAEAEAQAPFDLNGPLVRARLLRLAREEHWLLLTLHHIVTDGWSMGVLWRELALLYEARCRGQEAALAPLPVQYADYALWQREWLQGAVLERQLGYWKRALADVPALELPTDRRRPLVSSYRGARVRFELAPALTQALKALSRAERATLFMTLLAAFQVLLYRYSGQEDLAVGVPVAGRSRPELEGLVGFFVNTLVLRGDLSGQPSFREYLARVRERALEAYAHQDLPFEKLVEELAPRRDASRNPLFQVMFVLQNTPQERWQLPGVQVEPLAIDTHSAKFDLTMELTEAEGRLLGVLEYATDLFDAATAERMLGHFRVLLESIVADAGQRVAQLELLEAAERRRLLVEWNDTARPYPREATIQALFEAQVERSPGAIAVSCAGQELTYGELNARANRLAHELRTRGVGPDVLVGLCLERSLELVVALLGVLKAGGAYVPLDPSYPAERLAFMLEDTRAPVLITQERLLKALPPFAGHTLCLERDSARLAQHHTSNPEPRAQAHHLAYVIYTSGSTGKPKGVMIEQRGVVRLVSNADYVHLGPADCVAQASNASFDAMTFEVWGALLSGARLVVLPKATLLEARALEQAIAAQGITTLFLTTALFNRLAQASPPPFSRLTHLLFGGETADPGAVRRVLGEGTPRRLLHVYGPTETTTFATWHEVAGASDPRESVPIGQPIANTTARIVDAHGALQPAGVPGELLIGGDGVARGYLQRPELTAEKFVPDLLTPGARLYRTGDFARYRNDGYLEFLGRRDQQVKIRGFRIETGEIESVLASHPQISACAVVARETTPGDKALAAYFTTRDKTVVDKAELRRFLGARLPDFMLPASLVTLPSLPLTPNGKIDRGKLPAIPVESEGLRATPPPGDQLELHLAKLFERLLNIMGVNPEDDFFVLGGHSLLAAQLFDEIERRFGRRLPLDTLWYRGARVADLAQLLREKERSVVWPILVPIKPAGDKPPLFVVHTMGGNLFHYDDLAHALDSRQPVLGLQARGVYGSEQPRRRIEDIAMDCVVAMRAHQPCGPYRIAGYSSAGIVAYEMARQLCAAGEEVGLLALLDSFSPLAARRRSPLQSLQRLSLRKLQERIYHAVLSPLGLSRLRSLHNIGEAQRWAYWSYRPKRHTGGASLFLARDSLELVTEPTLGWARLVRGPLRTHHLPGGHSSLMKPPRVTALAAMLQAELDRVPA